MSHFSSQVLALAAAHIPERWLRADARAPLLAMADAVTPLQRLYFECRLAGRDRAVDVSQHFHANGSDPAILLGLARARIAAAPLGDPLWERLADFAQWWQGAGSGIVEFGLEHDLGVSVPAVFAGVPTGLAKDRAVAADFLAQVAPSSAAAWERVDHAIDMAAREGLVPGRLIGAMLSRDGQVRCVFRNLAPGPVAAFLGAIDWPGDMAALAALLTQPVFHSPAARLVLGFGPAPIAACGIEMIYRTIAGQPIPGGDPLVDWMVAAGLADAGTAAALAQWCGTITPDTARAPWPDALRLADRTQGGALPIAFSTTLSHFKLTLSDAGRLAAKAYLCCMPTRQHPVEARPCST